MNGNERSMNGNERSMNGNERSMNGNERSMNGYERSTNGLNSFVIREHLLSKSLQTLLMAAILLMLLWVAPASSFNFWMEGSIIG